MRLVCAGLVVSFAAIVSAQQLELKPSDNSDVMVAAVSRDSSLLVGGIGTGNLLPGGKVEVSPLAWVTNSGEWKRIACDENHPAECRKFDREYLRIPHAYTVVSRDGKGAQVNVKRMTLDHECFGYAGRGTSAGPPISRAAVAASSSEIFSEAEPATLLTGKDAQRIRDAMAAAVGAKLDSKQELRVYSIQLEGQNLFAIERAYQNYGSKPQFQNGPRLNFVFAIGSMQGSRFRLLSWQNQETNDENESMLGTVRLKNGREFLVNTVSDPESQFFRIYGIHDGKMSLVFKGGGGGC